MDNQEIISVEHVSMRFSLASEKVTSFKEYVSVLFIIFCRSLITRKERSLNALFLLFFIFQNQKPL